MQWLLSPGAMAEEGNGVMVGSCSSCMNQIPPRYMATQVLGPWCNGHSRCRAMIPRKMLHDPPTLSHEISRCPDCGMQSVPPHRWLTLETSKKWRVLGSVTCDTTMGTKVVTTLKNRAPPGLESMPHMEGSEPCHRCQVPCHPHLTRVTSHHPSHGLTPRCHCPATNLESNP